MSIIERLACRPEPARTQTFSVECYPPRTPKGHELLDLRVQKFHQWGALFVDLTWGAGGSTRDLTLPLSAKWQDEYNIIVNMHLTCTNQPVEQIQEVIQQVQASSLVNLVALRGDPPKDQEEWTAIEGGFNCALDLIRHLRSLPGNSNSNSFCLTTAGYPEGHPDRITHILPSELDGLSPSELKRLSIHRDQDQEKNEPQYYVCRDDDYQAELVYLKAKVDAGADLIITQLFFDPEVFLQFVRDCRQIGITCPILPGIMLIQNYAGFRKMVRLCRVRVPEWIEEAMRPFNPQSNKQQQQQQQPTGEQKAALQKTSVDIGVWMAKNLLDSGDPVVDHLHFYTMNQERQLRPILQQLKEYFPFFQANDSVLEN